MRYEKIMTNLVNHFLVASPSLDDDRFKDALIYLCRCNAHETWGFIINKPLPLSVGGLLGEMNIDAGASAMQIPALDSGPMRPEAGFILHTGLPVYHSSFAISDNICLTTSKDILNAIAKGSVSHYLMCMGFCTWQQGQLEQEIARGDWLVCPAEIGIIFGDNGTKLDKAYQKLGINLDKFDPTLGNA